MATPTPLSPRPTGWRLPNGDWFNDIINRVNGLVAGTIQMIVNATNFSMDGVLTMGAQLATAAGSNSQANALAITKSNVVAVVVAATTRALRLPAAATGKVVSISNAAALAVKVYPATGDRIGAAATNAVGAAIATMKANTYRAVDATRWVVEVGA